MNILLFLALILACAVVLLWVARKSSSKKDQSLRREAKAMSKPENPLQTPASYLLANRDDVWRTKREKASGFSTATSRFARASGEPPKGGFTERDPNEVVVGTAHIREQKPADEPSVTPIEYEEKQANN